MRKEDESRTNFKALMEMSDDDIDYSDIPSLNDELLDKGFVEMPKKTEEAKVAL